MGPCQSSEAAGKSSRQPLVAIPVKPTGGHAQANRYVNSQSKNSEASADTHPSVSGKSSKANQLDGYSSESASAFSASNGYASGASTPVDNLSLDGSGHNLSDKKSNPKTLVHSTSAIGLDTMIEVRKGEGGLNSNVVHIEVPFGKPIEEIYDGVHSGPVLGSGISGLVRLVTHKATGVKYAVKCLDLGLVDSAEGLQQLREEIFIMCQLDHPNIIRLEEVYESHQEIYLVQELCLGGELFDRLDEQPDYHYTEAECARLVKQMLCAVRYLHSKGIIHRDLKLENFLFSSTAPDSELKMIDFGLSKHFKFGEVHHEAVGTPYTVAPEVIRGTYDERCDIWAIGVITFLLLSGDPPFGGCGGPEPLMIVRSNILRGSYAFEPEEIWCNVSPQAKSFIKALLLIDPAKRPTARHAQKHPWLKGWASRESKEDDKLLNPNVVKALMNFKEFSDMRKLLCEVLSFTLLPEQIKDLRREFEKMDTDGSGEISLSALKQVLLTNAGAGSLGALTEAEVEEVFNAMRVRKTETRIHWHEFIAASLSQCQVDDRNLRLAFDRLDSDHKGYITLDDIMDLMGNDGTENEEALQTMWRDSMMATKVQHSTRITYDDFLLLMKGQTREADLELSMSSIKAAGQLDVVPEVLWPVDDEEGHEDGKNGCGLPLLTAETKITLEDKGDDRTGPIIQIRRSSNSSAPSISSNLHPKTTFVTEPVFIPTNNDTLVDGEIATSLSMDDEDDGIVTTVYGVFRQDSGPGVPGSSASLTPPQSPRRGPTDYVTPLSGRRTRMAPVSGQHLEVPEIPSHPLSLYERRRSRSVDDQDNGVDEQDVSERKLAADTRRAMALPHNQKEIDDLVMEESKSSLVVNRKLYRAHRQMRLAVLEASKRFEENQARRAHDTVMAQSEGAEGMIQAGLVMRHGIANQISSEAIRKLLQDNAAQQQALVEKANRRGGRGRRTRKKTISDMSGMLSSMGQDELLPVVAAAVASIEEIDSPMPPPIPRLEEIKSWDQTAIDSILDVPDSPQLRAATVPGEFRRTEDPFSARGRYGAAERFGVDILSHLERKDSQDDK